MIYLNDFLNLINFKITGGSEYLWNSFGRNARYLDSECSDYSLSCVFDSVTQELYLVSFSYEDNDKHYAFRWINPKHKEGYIAENVERNLDYTNFCDETTYVDFDDILQLINVVETQTDLKKYTTMSIELDDDVLLFLTRRAMEMNVTVDTLICNILRDKLAKIEAQDPEIMAELEKIKKEST